MREYVMSVKTYPVGSNEPAGAVEVSAAGSSPRVALNRGMTLFAHNVGIRKDRYGGASIASDYQLVPGQKLTIDITRVK